MESLKKRIEPLKKRIFWGFILMELLVVAGLLLLFSKEGERRVFSPQDYQLFAGEFQENGDFYIDELSGMEQDICLSTTPLSLKKGLYRVELSFDGTGEQVCKIEDDTLGYGELLVNAFSLHDRSKTNETGITFRLKSDTDSLRIKIHYTGAGALWIKSISLQQTSLQYGIYLVYFLMLATLLDVVWGLYAYDRWQQMSLSTRKVGFWLIAIGFVASYPMFIDYIHLDDDVYFHFTRIEGIVQAWKAGQFPARMHPNWLNGLGYPVSIMYGDVFLWPTALLHLLGFDLMESYKMGVVLLNFVTVFVCYYCFRNIFQSKKVGLFGTAIYTLSLYRLYNIYMRGAVGEYTAMTFFPVICYGLWQIFSADKERAKEKKNILLLVVGYSGLVLSHVLSLEFACLFTILICLVLWKRTFRKETFWTLASAAGISILITLWFLVPFFDYSMHLEMRVFNFVNHIQYKGLFVAQLLSLFQWAGGEAYMIYEGMRDVRPFGMGMAFLLSGIAFYYIWLLWSRKYRESVYWGLGKLAVCLGTLAAVFCLHIFPWEAIASSAVALEKVISSIQFPYRFLVIVSISFTITGCVLLKLFYEANQKKLAALWSTVIIALTLFTAVFFLDDDLLYKSWSGLRNPEAMGSEMVSGMEYLLMDTNIETLKELPYNRMIEGEQVTIEGYTEEAGHREILCTNEGDRESYLEANLLYYIGYHAKDQATGQSLPVEIGEEGILRVVLPAHYQGTVVIDFDGQWYWHVADWISILALLALTVWMVWPYLSRKLIGRRPRKWMLMLMVQGILLLWSLTGLFTAKKQMAVSAEQFQEITTQDGQRCLESESFSLAPGIYKAKLQYQTQQDCAHVWSITGEAMSYQGMLGNTCMLYSGLQEAETMIWVKEPIPSAKVQVMIAQDGELTLQGVQIAQSKLGSVVCFTTLLFLFGCLDGCYFYLGRRWKAYALGDRTVALSLAGIFCLSCVPLFAGYVIAGADTVYHLLRVEGIKEGLLAGQFPVRIHPGWLQGHGYATGIFYCDTFLYLPALLRILGFPMGGTYLFYKFLVNGATVLVAYFSFSRMFKNRLVGVFGAGLYTLNIYRFICMYLKDHLGQYTAMIFLPLLLYGLYRLLTEDTQTRGYTKIWQILTVAMTGILQSHILTCEMALLFGGLVCLIYGKKLMRKGTLAELGKAALVTLLLSSWFVVPFLDYMLHEKLLITGENVYTRTIQGYGSLLPQLMGIFHFAGSHDGDVGAGMTGEIPFSLGIGLLFVCLCFWYAWIRLKGRREQIPEGQKWALTCAGLGVLCLWMSTIYFPWDRLHGLGGIVQRMVSALQYPTRMLEMAALFLSVTGCISWIWLRNLVGQQEWKVYVGMTVLLVLLPTGIFFSDLHNSAAFYWLYDNHGMGNSYLSGREYLPQDTDESLLKEGQLVYPESVSIEHYEKHALQVRMRVENRSQEQQKILLPLLFYRGYQARDQETGDLLELTADDNHVVAVTLPAGYQGALQVSFVSPWYYRISEVLSMMTFVILLAVWLMRVERRAQNLEKRLQRKAESI